MRFSPLKGNGLREGRQKRGLADTIRSQVYNLQPLTSSLVIYDGGNVFATESSAALRGLATLVCDRSRGYALRYAPCFTPGYLLPRLRRALKQRRE